MRLPADAGGVMLRDSPMGDSNRDGLLVVWSRFHLAELVYA